MLAQAPHNFGDILQSDLQILPQMPETPCAEPPEGATRLAHPDHVPGLLRTESTPALRPALTTDLGEILPHAI